MLQKPSVFVRFTIRMEVVEWQCRNWRLILKANVGSLTVLAPTLSTLSDSYENHV
jgi:hypothetical protein